MLKLPTMSRLRRDRIDGRAAYWHTEIECRPMSKKRYERFIKWLHSSPEHEKAFQLSLKADRLLGELLDSGRIDVDALVEGARHEIRAARAARKKAFCITASVVALLGLVALIRRLLEAA